MMQKHSGHRSTVWRPYGCVDDTMLRSYLPNQVPIIIQSMCPHAVIEHNRRASKLSICDRNVFASSQGIVIILILNWYCSGQ